VKTKKEINCFVQSLTNGCHRWYPDAMRHIEIDVSSDIRRTLKNMFYNTEYRNLLRELLDKYEALIENKEV
jgi:DNA-dependent RNA polymerase auxiliary subunit epsilon